MGGAGADTAHFTGLVGDSTINLGGSGTSLISASGNVTSSTLIGGAGADTIDLTSAGFTTALVTSGGDNDIIKLDAGLLNASIVGGSGNDSIDILVSAATQTTGSATNTYFFGSGGGKDTINFSSTIPVRTPRCYRIHRCS